MTVRQGERLVSPAGVALIVTKAIGLAFESGGVRFTKAPQGDISDGAEAFAPVGPEPEDLGDWERRLWPFGLFQSQPPSEPGRPSLRLGERYHATDGKIEVMIIRAGPCDLRYDGERMLPGRA